MALGCCHAEPNKSNMSSGRIAKASEKRAILKDDVTVIGQVKTGEKNDKGFPVSLDYFKIISPYAERIYEALGTDKPTRLKIVFLSDEVKVACNEEYEAYDPQNGLRMQGDGEIFRVYDPKGGKDKKGAWLENVGKDHPLVTEYKKFIKNGKRTLRLKFALADFRDVYGVLSFKTQGENTSIDPIITTFDSIFETFGFVRGLPFDLSVKKVSQKKDGGTKNFPVVSLVSLIPPQFIEQVKREKKRLGGAFIYFDENKIHEILQLNAAPAEHISDSSKHLDSPSVNQSAEETEESTYSEVEEAEEKTDEAIDGIESIINPGKKEVSGTDQDGLPIGELFDEK